MTLKQTIGFALVALAVASCSQLKEKPVVEFAMKDFKVESGCNKDSTDANCVTFEVQYPEFIGLDTAVRRSLNDRINYILAGSTGEPRSLKQQGDDYLKEFATFRKDFPEFDMGWSFDAKVKVLISSDTLISLQINIVEFTGGANYTYTTRFVNVEPATGTDYLLGAMLRPGFEGELIRLGEEELRNQLDEVASDTALQINDDDVTGDFELTDNYGFRKEGIVFFLEGYVVGGLADGWTEVLIPYEKLEDLKK
jgi:hypothetical protein